MASRDFLGGFGGKAAAGAPAEGVGSGGAAAAAAAGEFEEIELSLGLSLGGRFRADPAREEKKLGLSRSSSIASTCSLPGAGGDDQGMVAPPPAELMRTTSLPTENEEDRFRRRAMQCQRRLAAKRKRLERRNSMNSGRASAGASGRDDAPEAATFPTGFQLRRSAAASPGGNSSSLPEQGGAIAAGASSPPGSAMNTSSDNSSGQNNSLPPAGPAGRAPNGTTSREQPPPAPAPAPLRTLRSLTMSTNSTGDARRSLLEDMPMVSTRPEGPNGRKIDGFLYKYRNGEEVRIVCVCHGSFLTPAEFVRHGGGGDVANPLRHIVVNHQESLFL